MVVEGSAEEVEGHPRGTIGFGGDPKAEYTDTSETDSIARSLHVWLARSGDQRHALDFWLI